jgi:small subunit ribosomal protein S21
LKRGENRWASGKRIESAVDAPSIPPNQAGRDGRLAGGHSRYCLLHARLQVRGEAARQPFDLARILILSIERGCRVQVLVRDNNVDQALKALKKKMQREGIFREMKLRGHYEKPSEKKAREKAEAVRRARKLARKKLQREGLLPMKPKPVFGAGPGGERGGAAGGRGGPGAGPRGPR